VVAVAVDAWRWDQAAECGEKLEGREGEDGAAVAGGSCREVDDLVDTGLAVWCGCGAFLGPLAVALDTHALKRERRPGAISEEALAPCRVRAMDSDRCVEAEAAAGLPGEHVLDGVLGEQAAALEEAEHAALQRALEAEDVVGREMGRLVEGDAAVVALGEDAVQDDDVEVEVGVEGGTEAMQEGNGAELCVT
jgi:hypothetical protein